MIKQRLAYISISKAEAHAIAFKKKNSFPKNFCILSVGSGKHFFLMFNKIKVALVLDLGTFGTPSL